jgi:hypothetical protein
MISISIRQVIEQRQQQQQSIKQIEEPFMRLELLHLHTVAFDVPQNVAYFGAPSGMTRTPAVCCFTPPVNAARISSPGAARSGLSDVSASTGAGPLLENEVISGAVALK